MSRLRLLSPAFRLIVLSAAGTAAATCAGAQAVRATASQQVPGLASQGVAARVLPLVFEENVGQLPGGSAFAGRTRNYAVEVGATGLQFEMAGKGGQTIRLGFEGSKGGVAAGVSEASFRTNEYIGKDATRWRTGIRNFDRVALRGLYPGVDAEFYARGGEIEHDFLLAAGADAARLKMRVSGAKTMELSGSGDVVLGAEGGALRLRRPVAYQVMADGRHQRVDAAFAMTANGGEAELSFALGAYDHARALVIDPVISYATYVAGSAGSTPTAVAADAAGNAYLTGYTGSVKSSFYAAAAGGTPDPTSPLTTAFVAKLAAAASGSQIAWVTYYGSATSSTQATAIALGGSTVYVGGTVTDGALPTSTGVFDPVPTAGAVQYGFVGTFAASTGTFAAGTYVEGGQTVAGGSSAVTALAVNAAGAVTAAGYTTGALFPTSTSPAPLIASNDPSVQNVLVTKGLLLTLDQALMNELYGTYVCGDTCATLGTTLTGVAVDPLGNLYISGSTAGDFPQAGVYVAANPTATPPVVASAPPMNMPPVGKVGMDAFAAQIVPATQTIGYSFWSGGTGNDAATGLALNANESDLYVFGSTSSVDLVTNGTTTSGMTKSGTTATPLDANYPAAATTSGFLTHVDGTGQLVATTYLGGSSIGAPATATATTVSAAALDGAGNVYVAGATSAPKAGFPQATSGAGTVAVSGVPLLPALEDLSADSAATTPTNRGYLVELPSSLGAVTYLANLGPSVGSSMAVGVALDGAVISGANAYVLLQSMDGAGGAAFTTASATQQTAQVTNGTTASAYLAQIAFAAPQTSPAIAAGTDASSPNPVYYQTPGTALPVTLTWNITGASSTGAYGLVFNLPYSTNLVPYTSVPSVSVGGNAVANVCTLGVSSVANTSPGITCVIPPALLQSATAQFVLNATLSTAATTTSASTFNIPAVAFDDHGDQLVLTQAVTTAQVPALTLTGSVSTTTANAALSATDTTTPNTAVTYTYVISNTTGTDSPTTSLIANLPAAFQAKTVTLLPAGCDPTLTTCDVAPHSTLRYSVTGVFLGSLLSSTASGPFSEAVTAPPSVMFGPGAPFSPVFATPAPAAVSVQGNAQLSASITAGAGTYTYPAGAAATGFTLGDAGRTLVATVTNSGPNQAGPGSATIALPRGFTPTTFTGCTVSGSSLNCPYTSLPGNGTVSFNIAGAFNDTGTSTDAVAPPATSAAPTQATVANSATSGAVTAQVSGVTPAAGTYAPATTYGPAFASTVTRVNALTLSAAVAPVAGNVVTTFNETNTPHQNDQVTYVVTLTSSGPSVARGVLFTIPIATVTGGSVPSTVTLGTVAASYSATNTSAANQLTCSASTTAITCYENDLKAPSVAPSAIPAAQTYTVTFTASYNETTIPASQANGQLPVTQGPGTLYAASTAASGASYEGAPGTTGPSTTITVQRLTHLVQTLSVSRVGSAPSTYADQAHINLDEHTGTLAAGTLNKPGVNDTVTITATTTNTGPNDAVAVSATTPMVSIPVPPFMLVVSVPAYCSFGGVSGGTAGTTIMAGIASGANGASMMCTPPVTTSAVPPGTVSQIGSDLNAAGLPVASTTTVGPTAAYPYTAPSAGYDGKNFVVTFNAKYVDANPTSGTVPGTHATGVETFAAATASGADADTGTGLSSAVPAAMTVQRAAHVSLTAFPVPVYTNGTALPKDTVLVSAGQAEIAQAALGMNAVTRAGAAGKVYNCIRYVLTVANTGPNYGDASLNYALDQGPFVATQKVLGTPTSNPLPADCAGYNPSLTGAAKNAAQLQDVGELMYGTGTQTVNLDGFFDVGTLGAGTPGASNALAATFRTAQFTTNDYNDSNVPATGTATAGDYAGKQAVTVVNTPFNSPNNDPLTPGFGVTPAGGSPQVSLIFSTVTSPGITAYSAGATAPAAGLFPGGKSPNPPDLGATKPLYQAGKNPTYYNVPTTATVPSAAANPTSVCVSQAAGLPDVFVKPERSLLWVIQNATATTAYNTVPNISSAAPLSGDITTAVAPAGTAYTLTPAISFPQPPQAQPSTVCGQMNGFPTSATVVGSAPIANAPTLAVLEPVNFAPYVVAGTGGAAGGTVSKGSTVAQTQAFLLKSSTQTHDFNDSDPCYVGGARTKCDDNPYLYAFIFGGGNTGSSAEFTGPLLVSSLPADPALAPNAFDLGLAFNLSGSAQVNIAVADQATGADANNDKVGAPNYLTNPFSTQGGFLTGKSTAGFPVCDPGLASGTYGLTPSASVTKFCTSVADPTSVSPTERYVPAGTGYQVGNVATVAVIGSASAGSGLIPLPYPSDFTTSPPTNPPSAAAPTPAIAYVTPGQTAGFAWGWLNGVVAKSPLPAPTYMLACSGVASLTSNVPVSLPAGMSCNISTPDPNAASPTTFSYTSTNYIPTILVGTTGNSYAKNVAPGEDWRRGWGEGIAALLLPVLIFRRRLRKGGFALITVLLGLVAVPLISGCGSGGSLPSSANATPSGTYYFIVTATPTNSSLLTVTSAAFEVVVQKAN